MQRVFIIVAARLVVGGLASSAQAASEHARATAAKYTTQVREAGLDESGQKAA
ncbi:hypothetical protein [Nonomuraea basaltis]|uniref:hypothetical protein n=1 Tax=Nonomuraea basaltis TaxID=2495887 RepID=UPI001486CF68|nr:hypothetical protein [Nonomuraea basaltis]